MNKYDRAFGLGVPTGIELSERTGILAGPDYRNENGRFKNINEILNVKGIGEKTFEKIKDYITV